ncbi:hypothetical protein ACQCVO_21735 [Bacillus infantis]|uniref:hypothetical protein n=1 Tax=Bacillus infantis TaxID=324767 RepID=UPI003CEFEA51
MRRIKTSILILTLLLTSIPINAFAVSPDKLPVKVSSEQWSLEIGKPDSPDSNNNKSRDTNLYNLYSMDLNNIGNKNIKLIRIEAFRDDPKLKSDIELFTIESDKLLTPTFHHNNFPLLNGAKLKVIVTWTVDQNGDSERKYQDRFIFDN